MPYTLRHLAELVHGQLVGDGEILIHAARPLGEAQNGDITFVESDKYVRRLHESLASAAVVSASVPMNGLPLIQVADPLTAFVAIVRHLRGRVDQPSQGIDARAIVHPSVQLGKEVAIDPLAVVGEGTVLGARCRIHSGVVIGRRCRLGDDVTIYPNVVLYDDTILGNRVIVHSNSVIGADGFGYRQQNGRHEKVPQLGHVEIADDVEIGACTTIDRGTFQATTIGEGTKIDNHVQIGHNCRIGRHNLLVSQVGIAGSSTTGAYVVAAGQSGIIDHLTIGDGVVIGAKAGVTKNVDAGQRVLGTPAMRESAQKRIFLMLEKLPDLRMDVRKIKQHLGLDEKK